MSAEMARKFLVQVDPERIKAFNTKWGNSIGLLPKTDSGICLPSVEGLNKLSLAQAELGRSFGKDESKKFAETFGAAAKSSIQPSKVPLARVAVLSVSCAVLALLKHDCSESGASAGASVGG